MLFELHVGCTCSDTGDHGESVKSLFLQYPTPMFSSPSPQGRRQCTQCILVPHARCSINTSYILLHQHESSKLLPWLSSNHRRSLASTKTPGDALFVSTSACVSRSRDNSMIIPHLERHVHRFAPRSESVHHTPVTHPNMIHREYGARFRSISDPPVTYTSQPCFTFVRLLAPTPLFCLISLHFRSLASSLCQTRWTKVVPPGKAAKFSTGA
jgi:hypothetical protein